MSASKYSEEFKQQVVLEVVEKSRTISEVAKSYGLVPQTVGNWVNKWRKTHSGIEGEEMTAAQLAEYKKIKAELREARMGDRFLEKSGGLLRAGVLIKTRYAHIHRGEGNYPTRLMCRCLEVSHSGYYAWRNSGMSETQKRREELAIFVTYSSHKTKSCHWAASPESPPMDKTPTQSQVRLYFHLATGKGFCLKSAIDGEP